MKAYKHYYDNVVDDGIITLKSSGKYPKSYEIDIEYITLSKLLVGILKVEPEYRTIEMKEVSAAILAHVVRYLKHHRGKMPAPIPSPVRSIHMKYNVKDKWDATFIDQFDKATVIDITMAA